MCEEGRIVMLDTRRTNTLDPRLRTNDYASLHFLRLRTKEYARFHFVRLRTHTLDSNLFFGGQII